MSTKKYSAFKPRRFGIGVLSCSKDLKMLMTPFCWDLFSCFKLGRLACSTSAQLCNFATNMAVCPSKVWYALQRYFL